MLYVDNFKALVLLMDEWGMSWAGLAADSVPFMVGRKFCSKQQNNDFLFIKVHTLYSKTLRAAHAMDVITKTINSVHSKGLEQQQFNNPVRDKFQHDLLYYT